MAIANISLPQTLFVMVGNSRIHWAYYEYDQCIKVVHSPHRHDPVDSTTIMDLFSALDPHQPSPKDILDGSIPLVLASVVPAQTSYFGAYPNVIHLSLKDIPLPHTYPNLGIDRALALVGGGYRYGFPCLVIDGGTALTYTGANDQGEFMGGAIAVGLRQQLLTLAHSTANLPLTPLERLPQELWAHDTETAIINGVLHHTCGGVKFFIAAWLEQFPHSTLVVTGGDGPLLYQQLRNHYPLIPSAHCIFDGMAIAVAALD